MFGRSWPLLLAVTIGGCSTEPRQPAAAANASTAPSGVPPPAPAAAPSTATPTAAASTLPAAAAVPLSDDAPPEAVVRRYGEAIAARRYGEARALWADDGRASGMSPAAFAARFDRYARFDLHVGAPRDPDAGAGQRYVTIPVEVTGTLRTGAPFRLQGSLVLHKVADEIDGDQPHMHAWRIRSGELRPASPVA